MSTAVLECSAFRGSKLASIYDLKPAFQNLLRPLCLACARAGMTANMITVFALILSVAMGATVAITGGARWSLLLVPVALFVRMALNAIDGMLAREHDMRSDIGAILNELGDVVSDSAIYLPFALISGVWPIAVIIFVLLAIVSEMSGVVAVQIGASRRYDGPMGKSDRAFFVGAAAVLLALDWLGSEAVSWAFVVAAVLLVITIWNRARRALLELG